MAFSVKCVPVLKSCYFCNVRETAIILSWFGMICNVFIFVSYGRSLIRSGSSQLLAGTRELVMNELGVMAVFLILHLLMMCGIHNRRPKLMLPYLVTSLIAMVIVAMYLLLWPLYQIMTFPELNITDLYLSSFVITVIAAAYWLVMYSHYRQLEEERKQLLQTHREHRPSSNSILPL